MVKGLESTVPTFLRLIFLLLKVITHHNDTTFEDCLRYCVPLGSSLSMHSAGIFQFIDAFLMAT
jgi:hypothetical protein